MKPSVKTLAGTAFCAAEPSGVLFTTAHRVVDLTDPASEAEATAWREEMTSRGGG